MMRYLPVLSLVLTWTSLTTTKIRADQGSDHAEFDELKVVWDDDFQHPRKLEKEPVDYVEKTIDLADQFAAFVGGFDGAMNMTTFLHDEIAEILGHLTPEQEKRRKARDVRLKTFLPMFDNGEEEKPNSKEVYSFDLGTGKEKVHTAKDMLVDGFVKLYDFVKEKAKSRKPMPHIFNDEL